ncbi:MAG: PEP-utilizing enzyme [Candidatus Micrarchaeota archaeon]
MVLFQCFCSTPPWNEEHYAIEISEKMKTSSEKLLEKIVELENFNEKTRENNKNATQGVNSQLPEIIRILSFTRNEAELVLGYGQCKLQPFYKEVCKRLRISIPQLRYFTETELKSAILQGKADETMLNNRIANGIGFYSDAKTFTLLTSEEFKEFFSMLGQQKSATSQMLCACPGKANGKIRIVKNEEDIKNFQQGEVLVAMWTCIDYLPAMKKASAFITEGGGITSHASVIAREFNIPCIIGYKNAATIFKNGDEVEINAEKLIVKKIS